MKMISIILLISICYNGISQHMEYMEYMENNKYLTSLLYLKTNQELNNKIKRYFKRELKKSKFSKDDYLMFNLSSKVYFQSISNFEAQINYSKYQIDKDLIKDRLRYQQEYDFETYESEFFAELIPNNSSPLYLAFSKPIDNYLLAEIYVETQFLGDGISLPKKDYKRGVFVHLLFFFKDNGSIEEVYIKGFHYN